jgi:ribosomal protein S17
MCSYVVGKIHNRVVCIIQFLLIFLGYLNKCLYHTETKLHAHKEACESCHVQDSVLVQESRWRNKACIYSVYRKRLTTAVVS